MKNPQDSNEKLYCFIDENCQMPSWFTLDKVYKNGEFRIPLKWRIKNNATSFAFKMPGSNSKGVYVGTDNNYKFYLQHILVTDTLTSGAFLILLDLNTELLPDVKKKRGEKIQYLKKFQPAYNILCPIWQ